MQRFITRNDGESHIVESISVKAEGMKRGMVADINAATRGLSNLLDQAENQFNEDIAKVSIGVAGSHLIDKTLSHKINIGGKEVTKKHIDHLTEAARDKFSITDKELLHIIAKEYTIDNREPVSEPIGFSGKELSGEFCHLRRP